MTAWRPHWALTAALLLSTGCQLSATGPQYAGEPLLTVSGQLLVGAELPDAPVRLAVAWYSDLSSPTAPRASTTQNIDYVGSFPLKYTFSLYAPPPAEAFQWVEGSKVAFGVLLAYEDLNRNGALDRFEPGTSYADRILGTSLGDVFNGKSTPTPVAIVYIEGASPGSWQPAAPAGYSLRAVPVEQAPLGPSTVTLSLAPRGELNLFACSQPEDAVLGVPCTVPPSGGVRVEGELRQADGVAGATFRVTDGVAPLRQAVVEVNGVPVPFVPSEAAFVSTGALPVVVGLNEVRVTSADAGYVLTVEVPGPATITRPELPVAGGSAHALVEPLLVEWRAANAAASYRLEVDGALAANFDAASTQATLSPLPLGNHTLSVTALASEFRARAEGGSRVVGLNRVSRPVTVVSDLDRTPPIFTPKALVVNGGDTVARSVFITVALDVADAETPVVGYCLTLNDTLAPRADAACWRRLEPTNHFTATIPARLGFEPGPWVIRAWARNAEGLVNEGVGVEGTDVATVTLQPVEPPHMSHAVASATPTGETLTTPVGTTVYVRWRTSGAGPLATNPISVWYSLDDAVWQPVAMAVPNAKNAGCSLEAGDSGCFAWVGGAPTSQFFRVRVGAVDVYGQQAYQTTQPLNVDTTLRILAGTTDPGTEGHAARAVFATQNTASPLGFPQSMVVTESGVVYFNDAYRGLLSVAPQTGTQRLVLPRTGTSVDGPVPGATLRQPMRLALDQQERVLIYDYDTIRRYDPTSQRVDTVVGGGTDSTSLVVAPRALAIAPPSTASLATLTMFATPDGLLYFQAAHGEGAVIKDGYTLRVYDPLAAGGAGEVRTIRFSGAGDGFDAQQPIGECRGVNVGATFDAVNGRLNNLVLALAHTPANCGSPTSSTYYSVIDPATWQPRGPHPTGHNYAMSFVVGADGALYRTSRVDNEIARFDDATHAFERVVGSGHNGGCPDGTPALECDLDVSDVWATRTGLLYFVDRGRIRTLDSKGHVFTVMGASLSAGDGDDARAARIGTPFDVKTWRNGTTDLVVFADATEFRFREFEVGAAIQTIAGNGSAGVPTLSAPAAGQPLAYNQNGTINEFFIQVHPTTGTVFSSRDATHLSKIDRATGRWFDLAGGGSIAYYQSAADGAAGPTVDFTTAYAPKVVGFDGADTLVVHKHRFANARYQDSFLKTFTLSTNTLNTLAGTSGAAGLLNGPDGDKAVGASVSYVPGATGWDTDPQLPGRNRWLFMTRSEPNRIRAISADGTLSTLATLKNNLTTFVWRRDARQRLYGCTTTGTLVVYDVGAATETELPWPLVRMRCLGGGMAYSSQRGSVVFGFTVDGVGGIGEYLVP